MSTLTVENVRDQALKLSTSARAYLAEALLASLEESEDFAVSDAWLAEAKRRGREIDAGRGRTIPGAKALRALRRTRK